MAQLLSVAPHKDGHRPSLNRDGQEDSVPYLVLFNGEASGWEAAFAVRAKLSLDGLQPDRPWLRLESLRPEREGPGVWRVEAVYRQADPDEPSDNPLDDPTDISVSFATKEVPIWELADGEERRGKPLANSAGQYFDPPPTKQATTFVVGFSRHLPVGSPVVQRALAYQGAVSSDTFFGVPAGKCRYTLASVKRDFYSPAEDSPPVPYLVVTEEVSCDPDGWQLRLIDRGDYYLEGGQKKNFEIEGNPVVGLLDGDGGKLADGADPEIIERQIYPELPFSALGLPQGF